MDSAGNLEEESLMGKQKAEMKRLHRRNMRRAKLKRKAQAAKARPRTKAERPTAHAASSSHHGSASS